MDKIADYYDEVGFKDWVHAETGTEQLKAQHPEFEMWNQGIHSRSGVACADCHMPYTRVGALKISDHHVRSPLLNINNACQTCHKWPEAELLARVEAIQDRTVSLRNRAMDALMDLITDIKAAKAGGASRRRPEGGAGRPAPRASSTWTSWSRRTPTASTRPRRPCASWARPSTTSGRDRSRCGP